MQNVPNPMSLWTPSVLYLGQCVKLGKGRPIYMTTLFLHLRTLNSKYVICKSDIWWALSMFHFTKENSSNFQVETCLCVKVWNRQRDSIDNGSFNHTFVEVCVQDIIVSLSRGPNWFEIDFVFVCLHKSVFNDVVFSKIWYMIKASLHDAMMLS